MGDAKDANIYNLRIGQRVKFAREHRKFTEQDMASKLGALQYSGSLSECEAGVTGFAVWDLYQVGRILGIPIHYLLGEDAILDWLLDHKVATAYRVIGDDERIKLRKIILAVAGDFPFV